MKYLLLLLPLVTWALTGWGAWVVGNMPQPSFPFFLWLFMTSIAAIMANIAVLVGVLVHLKMAPPFSV